MSQFDSRIFKVELFWTGNKLPDLTLDGGLYINASGMKYANAIQNDCNLQISNLKKETRDHLATQLTQWNYNQKRKHVRLHAGRVSTGLALVYSGDIIQCTASQPPNINLNIKCQTMAFWKQNFLAQSQNVSAPVSQIVNGIGKSLGTPDSPVSVRFEATDKNISNYSYTGSSAKQIDKLNTLGLTAYMDDNVLVVKDRGAALKNEVHTLNMNTGMIGVPELTDVGVRVKMLFTPKIKLGGILAMQSYLNPLIQGNYYIYQMGFELASRDTPFYAIAYASKYNILLGAANLPNA